MCSGCGKPCDPKQVDRSAEYDYEELKKLPLYAELMRWDKSDLAAHSIKYQSLCGEARQKCERLEEILKIEIAKVTDLNSRVEQLEKSIGFACHLLALGITGHREKKGTIDQTLIDLVDKACKEYSRIRK